MGTATASRIDGPAALGTERGQLVDQGFCVLRGLLPADLLVRLRIVTGRMLDALRIRHLLPDYAGNAAAAPWNRIPGHHLARTRT